MYTLEDPNTRLHTYCIHRLWVKILHDLGYLNFDEPFKKLINQGKITGDSRYVYRHSRKQQFVSAGLKRSVLRHDPLHVDVNMVTGLELDIEVFQALET